MFHEALPAKFQYVFWAKLIGVFLFSADASMLSFMVVSDMRMYVGVLETAPG